ncbi:hypothetical protein LJR231_002258 [Phyllobacterium sp. LjRoot231]|uniref:hypothetical protein n=1 Tax=Phyllobacterium sp. LjRoot231 TaxID=3342289 RepID=UPI003ED14358
MPQIFQSNSGSDLAKKQNEATQRKSLADLARQQGEVDQATATTSPKKTGGRLLTFLSGSGQETLG